MIRKVTKKFIPYMSASFEICMVQFSERLRIEMELKLEKERRKKKAIEDLMARELEHTVVNRRGHKRHSEERERPQDHKRYRHDDKYPSGRDRGYGDLHRDDYDSWDRRGDRYASYDYR